MCEGRKNPRGLTDQSTNTVQHSEGNMHCCCFASIFLACFTGSPPPLVRAAVKEGNAMVIPLLLLSLEDNLRMNCSPVRLSNVCGPGLHKKLWSGFLQVKRRSLSLPDPPGIIIVVV